MNSDFQGKPTPNGSAIAYHAFVDALAKPGSSILDSLDADKCNLMHAVIGISGEAGELLDAIKKHVIYGKALDKANVIEELGDLRFYMQMVMNALFIGDNEIMNENMRKLGKRYASLGYSDEQAQARADKLDAVDTPAPSSFVPVMQVWKDTSLLDGYSEKYPSYVCKKPFSEEIVRLESKEQVLMMANAHGWTIEYVNNKSA